MGLLNAILLAIPISLIFTYIAHVLTERYCDKKYPSRFEELKKRAKELQDSDEELF